MEIQQISSPAAGQHNEDLVAVYRHPGCTDIVIMDGATSVAERDYVDDEAGDVVWFVRKFAAVLGEVVGKDIAQQDSVLRALRRVESAYRERAGGVAVPQYAVPLAAMTWVRITASGDDFLLKLFCLGDCKAFLLRPDATVDDLDPYVNPHESVMQAEVARLAQEGVADHATRFARLLPILRARREFHHTTSAPIALVPSPQGPLAAREYEVRAAAGSMLIGMTDGFYRAVDTYGLYSIEELSRLCAEGKLPAILQALRDFECGGSDGMNQVKKADDASAVTCHLM